MAPVCAACKLQMAVKDANYTVEEMSASDGIRIWSSSLFACPSCGIEVIHRAGERPIIDKFFPLPDYERAQKAVKAKFWLVRF